MSISESQRKAVAKYNAKSYDELKVRVPKGDKDKIKSHADNKGESLNGFINRAIRETIDRDSGNSD